MHLLPVHDTARAAALRVALGCEIEPRAHRDEKSGAAQCVWNVVTQCGEAGQMLEASQQKTLPADHPFHVCTLAIEAAATLQQWLKSSRAPTVRRAAAQLVKFSYTGSSDIQPGEVSVPETIELRSPDETARLERTVLHAALQPMGIPLPLMPHHFAAAAIVVGCLPLALSGTAAAPLLHLTAGSVTIPGLTLTHLGAAALGRAPLADPEHPFTYAFEAIRTFAGYRYTEQLIAPNPVHFYRGEGFTNPNSALVSEAQLRSNTKLHTGKTFRDHLTEHLAGV